MLESLKRALFFVHRWAGIVLGVLIVLWFASGIVTMYVGYPKLTPAEARAQLTPLDPTTCCVSFEEAWHASGGHGSPERAVLSNAAGRPTYKFSTPHGLATVDAVSGTPSPAASTEQALAAARRFLPGYDAHHIGTVNEDIWSRASALHPHRPLHRIEMDDAARTRLYVSSATGEVVLDAPRSERYWSLAGPWLHWLHIFRGAMPRDDWRVVIISLSIAGLLLTLTGLTAGLMRWNFRGKYPSGRRTPYRPKYLRWHHVTGLVFAAISLTWIFSGMMSVNPWGVFGSHGGGHGMATHAAPVTEHFAPDTRLALTQLSARIDVLQLEWHAQSSGAPYLVATGENGVSRIATDSGEILDRLPLAHLRATAQSLFPAARVIAFEELTTHDRYFYPRAMHTLRGHHDRRLPVVRAQFDDDASTWSYLSPYSGTVLLQVDAKQRVERWLFWFLHSWDARALLAARPLWDVLMLVFSAGGLAVGITGVVIGVRRLRSKLEAARARAAS